MQPTEEETKRPPEFSRKAKVKDGKDVDGGKKRATPATNEGAVGKDQSPEKTNNVVLKMCHHTQVLMRTLAANFTKLRSEVQDGLSVFEADKIALTDYALESAGGRIVSIRNTEPYPAGAPPLKILGVQICHPTNAPQAIIQPGVLPGECWAFKGSTGSVVIRLVGQVRVSSVSLEHIPQSLSPTGEVSTAPKEFSVWGLSWGDDTEGFFFGQFTYDIRGKPLQRFNVTHETKVPHPYVEVKFHSNHGNHEYTCVYRFRVHGALEMRPGVR
ncbi:klaroid protein-like [Anabrus simplex]|uniref:klaroid protein-like n=1 Tax=Anabrus simplex TaxID=316456 RepID=UPI0035A2B150